MKKSLVVLLIAVLALSAVFAADVAITATGEVEASYVVDFDNMTGTYNVPELDGDLEWAVDFSHEVNGSKYPYISVAGEIEVDFTDDAAFVDGVLDFTPEVDFTTFEIVGEDWKIDFLADVTSLDYAVSAIDTTWYAPKSKYYNARTGRDVEAALTYRWLTEAEYVVDAVSISKDGIGTITLAANNANLDATTEKKTETTYSIVYLANDAALKAAELGWGNGISYKAGAKTTVQYLGGQAGADTISKLFNQPTGSYADAITLLAAANALPEASKIKAETAAFGGAVGYNLVITTKESTYDYEAHNFAVVAETEELKLSDSITTQFGAGYAKLYANTDDGTADDVAETNKSKLGFSAKAAYEDILSVAYDCGYDFNEDTDKAFSFDVATSFKYEMVAIDVYLAKGQLSYYNAADLYKLKNYQYYTFAGPDYDPEPGELLLSAKASVEVKEIGTTFTFTGKDLLANSTDGSHAYLAYEAVNTYFDNYTFTFDASTKMNKCVEVGFKAQADYSEEVGVTAYAAVTAGGDIERDGYDIKPVFEAGVAYAKDGFSFSVDFCSDAYKEYWYNSALEGKFAFTVKAGYEAEMFTLSSAVEYNTHETAAYKYTDWALYKGLYVAAGIESDKLVDGATLSLEYESAELLEGTTERFGTLTAAVTVEF